MEIDEYKRVHTQLLCHVCKTGLSASSKPQGGARISDKSALFSEGLIDSFNSVC